MTSRITSSLENFRGAFADLRRLPRGFWFVIGAFVILRGSTGGPQNAALFYVLYLYQQAFQYINMGYASALAVFLFLVILGLTLLVFRSSSVWVYYESGARK